MIIRIAWNFGRSISTYASQLGLQSPVDVGQRDGWFRTLFVERGIVSLGGLARTNICDESSATP
jgi:hypothetical protein